MLQFDEFKHTPEGDCLSNFQSSDLSWLIAVETSRFLSRGNWLLIGNSQ